MSEGSLAVALVYVGVGCVGALANALVCAMLVVVGAFSNTAYVLMANIALADAVLSALVGGYVGACLLAGATDARLEWLNAFVQTLCWFSMITNYAALGINRCVGTRYAKSPAGALLGLTATRACATLAWLFGLLAAVVSTTPQPVLKTELTLWTSALRGNSTRAVSFMWFNVGVNLISISIQLVCNALILHAIYYTRKQIASNRLNSRSVKRFRKQSRLAFQFFYPSILLTISSLLFHTLPVYSKESWAFLVSHLVWLLNHACNPFFYLYFNERMRRTLRLWLRCRREVTSAVAVGVRQEREPRQLIELANKSRSEHAPSAGARQRATQTWFAERGHSSDSAGSDSALDSSRQPSQIATC